MIFEETSSNPWNDFWESVGEFFMQKDAYGVNYLTRILIAIGLIVVSYFIIKFYT